MKNYYLVAKQNMMEFLKFKNYRQMNLALAIFSFIAMLPFHILTFFAFGLLAVVYFFYYLFGLPAEFLLSFIKGEGKEVKHATQTIIYFIGFPTIFIWNVFLSLSMCLFYLNYIFFEIESYYASLAGVAFKPNLGKAAKALDEKATDEVKEEKRHFFIEPLVLVIVDLSLFLITLIGTLVLSYAVNAPVAASYFLVILCFTSLVFTLIYVPLAFGRKHVKKAKK